MNELSEELKLKFQRYNQKRLNNAFHMACLDGAIDIVQYLLTSKDLTIHAEIQSIDNTGIVFASMHGHLNVVRYLLTSPELTEHADIHGQNEDALGWAVINGHLEIVRYLLTSPELKEHAILLPTLLNYACENGHLNIVRYLLTSKELTVHADIHHNNDIACHIALITQRLDIVDYLLFSPELQDHAQIYDIKKVFEWLVQESHVETIEFLLSLTPKYPIVFQNTDCNVDWAIYHNHTSILKKMLVALYYHDTISYLDNVEKIKNYCQQKGLNFEAWKDKMMKDDIMVNSTEQELFL